MKTAFLVTASLVTIITTQVQAGFQFTAPIAPQPQVSIQPTQGALLPVIQDATSQFMPAVPAAPVVHAPIAVANTLEHVSGSMTIVPNVQSSQVKKNAHEIAVGFGNDLPLVTALRQIIPSDYSYVLDKNITVGQTVSWSGGQEWPVVLNNTLSQLGLSSAINDKIVTINGVNIPVVAAIQEPINVANFVEKPQQEPISVLPMAQPQMTIAPIPSVQRPQPIVHENITVVDTSNSGNIQLPPAEPIESQWMAQSGESLKTTLEAWSNIAGVDLFWSSDYDYPLSSDVSVGGEFSEAVEMLLAGFSLAQPKPIGRLHPNLPNGPAVLILETQQVTR
jgi:hypothetical protein